MHLIKRILDGRANEQVILQLIDLSILLETFNFHSHLDELAYFESIMYDLDSTTYLDTVRSILIVASDKALADHTIDVIDTITLKDRYIILDNILNFDNSDEDERIEVLLNSDLNNEELLCEILSLKSFLPIEHFLPLILSVDNSLFIRLREKIRQGKETLQSAEESKLIISKFNKYRMEVKDSTVLDKVVEYGFMPKVSTEALYVSFEQDILSLPIEAAVDQLVGIGLYAGLESMELEDEVAYYIDRTFTKSNDLLVANKRLYNHFNKR